MACIVLKNNKESILHKKLIDIFGQEQGSLLYQKFDSDAFIEEFGDFKQYRDNPNTEYIEQGFEGRLNEIFEPEIFNDDLGYYYINKEGKEYFKLKESQLYNLFQSEAKIDRLVEIVALDFIQRGAFNLNFDTLDFSEIKSNISLRESIEQKLTELYSNLIVSNNITHQINGYAVNTVSTNKDAVDELENKVKEWFKNRQLDYKDLKQEEDNEDDNPDNIKDESWSKASFETNTKDKISSNVKLRLSLMRDSTKVDSEFNEVIPLAFDEIYKKLSHLLSNNIALLDEKGNVEDLFETYKNLISENMGPNKIPYFTDLYNMLDGISKKQPKNENEKILIHQLKAEIIRAFNLHSNIFNTTELKYSKIQTKESGQPIYDSNNVQTGWSPTTYETKLDVEVFDASKTGKLSKEILTNWNLTIENYFYKEGKLINKEELKKIISELEIISNQKNNHKENLKKTVSYLNKIGINFENFVLDFTLNDLTFREKDEVTEAYHNKKIEDFINAVHTTFKSLELHKDNKNFLNTYMMKQLAEAQAFFNEDGSESAIHTAGKTKWLYSNPSYLSNKITAWKKDRNQLLEHYDKAGRWTQASAMLRHLLALDINDVKERIKVSKERLNKVKLAHFNVYQQKVRKGDNYITDYKDGKKISEQEYFVDTINKMLYSKKDGKTSTFRTTTAPGKSTQFETSHDFFFESKVGYNSDTNKIVIPKETIDLVWNYLQGEFYRMNDAFKQIESGKDLVVYYHTDKKGNVRDKNGKLLGNAFKSQLFPSLSFNQIKDFKIYNQDGSINLEQVEKYEPVLRQFIKESLSEKIQKTFNHLINKGVVEKINENNYSNKLFDYEIFKKYLGQNKTASKKIMSNIAGDLFINGMINHIEYSKLYAGDVAYYKDSVDYIKRIGATYTDGIYQYLNNENNEFTIGVVESIEIKEPYLNELAPLLKGDKQLLESWNDFINSADAQAWITPKRWRDIMISTAKWSEQHNIVYNKLEGKNKEPLTEKELKLVAQPVKGVYFELKNGIPVYLKYSQAVLIPQLRVNTQLEQLHQYMIDNGLDELLTFDAIKAGAPIPTKIHDELGNIVTKDQNGKNIPINKLTLKSNGWKLQQDLPTKTFKETDIGSQIQKNMLLLVSDKFEDPSKTFIFGDNTYSAEEIIKLTDETFGNLIDKGLQDLYEEFGIDQNGKIQNQDKFYKSIVDEYIKRGGNDDTIKALKSNLSIYAIPGVKPKLDNIFAAIVKDRIVKIKTNGGSFIQMSNYGLSKTEADGKYDGIKWSPIVDLGATVKPYRYAKDKDGNVIKDILGRPKIEPNQILISGSFLAKYIPNYKEFSSEKLFGKLNPETNKLEGGMIDQDILDNIIGYRIPNQGPSSNDSLQIAGILPEGVGDTIVAFTGITKKTGSDFDIDKMYVMFPNFNIRTNLKSEAYKFFRDKFKGATIKETIQNLRSVFPEIEDEKIAKVLQSNETRIEFIKESFDELVQYVLDNKTKPEVKEIIKTLDIKVTGLKYIKSNTNSKKAQQNKIIELYKSMILHPDNINKIMTPLDHEFVKMDAQNIVLPVVKLDLDNFDFIDDISTKYSFMAGMAGVGQLANAFVDYAMGSVTDYYLEKVNLGEKSHTDGGITKFDKIFSQELSDKDLEDYLESFNKRTNKKLRLEDIKKYKTIPISDTLSALMNAFVDIAKDPYITNINWNMSTTNVGNMLIRGGVHPFYTLSFLAQPIIKEYTDFTSSYESQRKSDQIKNTRTAFMVHKVAQNLIDSTVKLSNGQEISSKILYEVIANNTTNITGITEKDFDIKLVKNVFRKRLGINLPNDVLFENIDDIKNILNQHYIYFSKKEINALNYDLKSLREGIFKNQNVFQANILNTFLNFQQQAKKMKANVDASKHAVNGMGKNTTSLLIALNRVDNIRKKGVVGYENKMSYKDGTKKLLGHYYDGLKGVKKIIQSNPNLFISANDAVWNSYNIISNQIYNEALENDNLGKNLEETFYSYLMSGFFDLNTENKIDLLNNFNKEFLTFKQEHEKEFYILSQLNLKPGEKRNYIGLTNKTNSKEYNNKMINSWKEMMKYHPEFSEKLIKYSFLTTGFNLTNYSFYQFIPSSYFIENGFNNYIKQFSQKLENYDLNFIDQFYLSNLNNSEVVKYKNSEEILETTPYSVTLKEQTDNNLFIKIGENSFKLIGYVNGNQPVYSNYIKTAKGYVKIKSLSSRDSKGFQVYNYNIENIPLPITKFDNKQLKELDKIFNSVTKFESVNVLDNVEKEVETLQNLESKKTVREYTPEIIKELPPNGIFVFGSNTEGRHGKGAALIAKTKFGAKQGQSTGLQGQSYAIVTKNLTKGVEFMQKNQDKIGEKSISLEDIREQLSDLFNYAIDNPYKKFYVTKLGSSLAGYTVEEIRNEIQQVNDINGGNFIPDNIILPKEYEIRNIELQQLSLFGNEELWSQIENEWLASGRTKEDFDNMTEEERQHTIKNCL